MKFKIDTSRHHVSSVLQYIRQIRNQVKGPLLCRGESQDYRVSNLESKLFRSLINHKNYSEYGDYKLYSKGSREFYRELSVPKSDNNKIKMDFMAYCQHHGFPTPLLDVTSSALVGLYFACSNKLNQDGYLFIFDKNKFIECFPKYLMRGNHNLDPCSNLHNLILLINNYIQSNGYNNEILPYWKDKKINIVKEFKDYFKNNKYYATNLAFKQLNSINSIRDLINILTFMSINNGHKYTALFNEYIKFLNNIVFNTSNERKDIIKIFKHNPSKYLRESYVYVFYIFMSRHINDDKQIKGFIPHDLIFHIRTNYDWDRVKAQNGSFILEYPWEYNNKILEYMFFQMLIMANPSNTVKNEMAVINKKDINLVNNIYPDYVIKINKSDKPLILGELDRLGINEESLFKSPDYISSYIQNKYFYKKYN